MNEALTNMRIDRWLWAVRLYKTRSLAAKACVAGQVKIAGQNVKPSRNVRTGDVITARVAFANRTIKVLALLKQRVAAKIAGQYAEDRTPPDEFARAREEALKNKPLFPPGSGRPTKKQRRQLEKFTVDQCP